MTNLFCSLTLPYCWRSSGVKLASLETSAVSIDVKAVFTVVFSAAEKCLLSKFLNGIATIF